MRRKSKNPCSALRDKCVTLAKLIARKKANFTCAYCGAKEPQVRTHGSHIYAEGVHRSMSADVDNILCICAVHHMAHSYWNNSSKWSWHGTPKEAIQWFDETYPALSKKLKIRSRQQVQADEFFWRKKYEELKKMDAELGCA